MPKFKETKTLYALILWIGGFWVIMAINPLDRHDWMLENILVVVFALLISLSYAYIKLSNRSYFLIILFLTLHITGSHYTYAKVPLGFYLADILDLERNHFDRIAHFAFGLLLAYPIYEALTKLTEVKGWLSYYLPIDVVMALSGLFEIIEWLVVELVNPDLGMAYLGTQGDVWDAQKDMGLAMSGGVIAIVSALLSQAVPRFKNPANDHK